MRNTLNNPDFLNKALFFRIYNYIKIIKYNEQRPTIKRICSRIY